MVDAGGRTSVVEPQELTDIEFGLFVMLARVKCAALRAEDVGAAYRLRELDLATWRIFNELYGPAVTQTVWHLSEHGEQTWQHWQTHGWSSRRIKWIAANVGLEVLMPNASWKAEL
jgi:hypothetical protein